MLPIAAITTTGKVVLLIVAGAFMVYALVCAMWIPRRNPTFPGKHLPLFLTVSALFFVVQIGTVVWVTSTQEVEHEASGEEAEPEGSEPAPAETEAAPAETSTETEGTETETEPTETETEPTQTETTGTETEPTATGDAAAGEAVFASAGCGGCHTLADAGATGSAGPNLDEAMPSDELVVDRVTHGKGVMPSFESDLTEQQIQDVAAYVSSVAGA